MRTSFVLGLTLVGCIPNLETGKDTDEPWSCPTNQWDVAEPPSGLEGSGFFEGQVLRDAQLTDQNGDTTCLWQFYGDVLVVDVSTVWCGPCQELAADVEETAEHYADDNVTYVTILTEDEGRNEPIVQDLADWGEYFGITQPILMDPQAFYSGSSLDGGNYPAIMVVDRTMTVRSRITSQPSDAKIRAAIDELLAAED